MKWGNRRGPMTSISRAAKKNERLKVKLEKNTTKADKNQVKVDKLTKKLTKHGNYITDIGYTMAKNTGRKLSRKLAKGNKLDKRITKIRSKIEKNETLMKTKLSDLPKDQIKIGREIVNSALKGE